jgi:hypothetical protein
MDHGFGVDVPETLAEFCRPERLALVVYDMHAGFAFAGDALVADVATLVPLIRGAMRRRDPPEGADS